MKKKLLFASLIGLVAISMSGCTESSNQIESAQQEALSRNAITQTGLPRITNFTEKKLMKHLYEIRDDKISTYTYYTDMCGKKHLLCRSVGFGLPYATQYSNPEQYGDYAGTTLPQAEPNGLYMPSSAEATWVQCVSPKGTIEPVYSEERLTISTFKLGGQ